MSMTERPVRAAVIGSGFGGLAVAIRLQTAGIQTTLFEAHDQPGGRAFVYRERGFMFDAGPTVITAPHCLEELLSEAGRRMSDDVELMPVSPFYRLLWSDGDRFDYTGDSDAMIAADRAAQPARRRRVIGASSLRQARVRDGLPRARGDAVPALRGHGAGGAAARAAARRSLGLRDGQSLRARRAPAPSAVVPHAARRRQPLRDQRDLHADPLPRAALGRVLSARRHRRARPRDGQAVRRARRQVALVDAGASASKCCGTARPCIAWSPTPRQTTSSWWCRTPTSHHTYARLFDGEPARRRSGAAREARLVDVAVRPLFRHRSLVSRASRAPHRPVRTALRRAAPRHLPRRECCPTTSACICTRRR